MITSDYEEFHDERIRNARFTAVISIVIALGINLVASFITNQPGLAITILIITSIITIFILAYYSGIRTSRTKNIHTSIVFDSKTGELTEYPDHIIQHLMRQTINEISKQNQTIKSKIADPSSVKLNDPKRSIFIDIAEVIILSRFISLLSFLPIEYLEWFQESSEPTNELKENSIVEEILAIKDNSSKQVLINPFDKFWSPRDGTFSILHDPNHKSQNFRSIVLKNRYMKINIDYHISGLWPLISLRRLPSLLELGGIPINPKFEDDANTRLINHGLSLVSFIFNVRAEILKPKLSLFILILPIKRFNKSILKFLSFISYFVDNIDYIPFSGSIDIKDVEFERDRMNQEFILTVLKRLENYLDNLKNNKD